MAFEPPDDVPRRLLECCVALSVSVASRFHVTLLAYAPSYPIMIQGIHGSRSNQETMLVHAVVMPRVYSCVYMTQIYFTRVASAAMNSELSVGGDSFLRFKYAVRRSSFESSSTAWMFEEVGAAVCDAEVVPARGSVNILWVHYRKETSSMS